MAGHDRRLSPIWAGALLMMAPTASAVSLTNFQPIIGVSVPISCILAYNYQIPGCTMNDFTRGNTCSDACVKGLTKIQYTVQAACPDVSADITSVLGQVLMGNLVELVCSVRSTSTTSSGRTSSTTSTETDDLEIPSSTSTPTSTSTSSSTTNFDTPIPTTTSQSSSTTSTSSSSSSTGRTASAQPTPGDSSGGGSPFDVASSDSRQLAACWVEAMGVALGLGLLLLR